MAGAERSTIEARPTAERGSAPARAVRLALCIEQTLGHRAHGLSLERAVVERGWPAQVLRIEYPTRSRVPMPWAARSSAAAYRRTRAIERPDVLFFHTQTVALLAPEAARGAPYVVSVDATPEQLDAYGSGYGHRRRAGWIEGLKKRAYRRVLRRAAAIVTWSRWAAASLAEDYGVAGKHIEVAHPGAPEALFEIERPPRSRPPRVLFVGGDFERKGGRTLLEAFAPLAERAELVLVTQPEVPAARGVRVLHGVEPGSAALRSAYAEADLFCLPSAADCTPVAIGEALAAGLPVVTTDIASNPEWVPAAAGALVPAHDAGALRAALERYIDDEPRRMAAGAAARDWARAHMSADANAARILDLLGAIGHGAAA